MKLRRTVLFFSITILLFSFARSSLAKSEGNGQFEGKKVLYINSYHEGYPWSDGIIRGIQRIFNSTGIHLETQYMDTKRNVDESFKKQAGTNAKLKIDTLNPDIVIVADDNASKYVIVPYYMNKTLPFVFCGVNWDASAYGFPADNVTGMIEVSLISQLIDSLKGYAKGDRIGLIGADNLSNRKEAKNYKDKLKVSLTKEVFVSTMNEWRKAFIDIQKKVDMLIVAPPSFLSNDLEKIEFETFMIQNTVVPTGSVETWIVPFTLLGYTKISEEQGEWAAKAALKILNGVSPNKIPLSTNKEGKLYLNIKIAGTLDIVFSFSMIKNAVIIE